MQEQIGERQKGERGAAFVMVLVAMTILFIIGAGFTVMISNQVKSLKADKTKEKAYFIAEAGLQRAVVYGMRYPLKPNSAMCAIQPDPTGTAFGDGKYTLKFSDFDPVTSQPVAGTECTTAKPTTEYRYVTSTAVIYESTNNSARPIVVQLSQVIHNPFSRAIWSTGDIAFRSAVDKRWCTLDFINWIIDALGGSSSDWGIVFCPQDLWSVTGKIYAQKRPSDDWRRYCPGIPGSILGGIAGTVVGAITGIPFLGQIGSNLGQQYLDYPEWWSSCGAKCLGWWSDIKDRYFFGWFIGCWSSCWYFGSTKSQCNADFADGEYNQRPVSEISGYPNAYGQGCCGIKLCFVCGILPCDLLGIQGPPGSTCTSGTPPCPSEAGFDANGDGIDDQYNYCCNPFIGSCGKKMGAIYRVKDKNASWRGCGGASNTYSNAPGDPAHNVATGAYDSAATTTLSWTANSSRGYLGDCDGNTDNDLDLNGDDEEQGEINNAIAGDPAPSPAPNKGYYYIKDPRPFPQVVPPPDPRTPGYSGSMVYMVGGVASQFLKDNGYLEDAWIDGDLNIDWKWWQSLGNQKIGIWGLVYVRGKVNFTAATFASLIFSAYPGFSNTPPASDPDRAPGTLMVQSGDLSLTSTGNPDFGRVNVVLLDGKSLTMDSCCGMNSRGIYYVGGPMVDHDKNPDTPKIRMGGDIIFSAESRYGWICNLVGGVLPLCKLFSSFTGSNWYPEIVFEGAIVGRNIYFIGTGQRNQVNIEGNPDLQIPESFYNSVEVMDEKQIQ